VRTLREVLMRKVIMMAAVLTASPVTPSWAQWRLGLGVGRDVYSGVSQGTFEDGGASFKPYHPLVWAFRAELPRSQPRLSIDLRYSTPDIALVGAEITLIPHGSFLEMLAVAPTAGWTLFDLSPGVTIEGEAGPVIERWRVEDVDDRTLLGVGGGLALRIELGGRLAARLSARLGITPTSPLSGALIEGYATRAAWRRGLEGSVLLRL
jgi:hypothetical protein